MKEFLLVALCALVFIVIFQISKVSEYVSILKGEEKTRKQNNKINGALFLGFLIFGLIGVWFCHDLYYPKTLFPLGSASEEGKDIDWMFKITTVATGIVFLGTQIALFWFAYKYQENDKRKAYYFAHSTKLELIWTGVPLVVLIVLVTFGLRAWLKITGPAPKESIVVEVTGHQFGWEFRYAGNDKILGKKDYKLTTPKNALGVDFGDKYAKDDLHVAGTMVIPVGIPCKMVINAQDVIHDVGLPHFRLKMDAVPGIPTTQWFTPNRTTEQMRVESGNANFVYEISCDQMCGAGHYSMRGVITVVTLEEYKKWLLEQKPEYYTIYPQNNSTDSAAKTAPKVSAQLMNK
jgi:cytochrome c oxidase subunit II